MSPARDITKRKNKSQDRGMFGENSVFIEVIECSHTERKNQQMSDKNTLASDFASEKLTAKRAITLMIQGGLIGAGGILPGVSGGILCVAFGLYMPLMQFFSNPFKELSRTWKKWAFVGIGGCIGLFLFAVVLDAMFKASEVVSQCLFAGLIIGTFPSLMREAKNDPSEQKRKVVSKATKLISFAIAFVIGMAFFIFLAINKGTTAVQITPNIFWYGVCGFIIGMGFVIPGLTSSTVLIFLGLLTPMLSGALAFDFAVIIPVGVGVILAILVLSRIVNFIFGKWYVTAFHAVIGLVAASTIAIIPIKFSGITQLLLCIGAAVVGFALSISLDKVLSKYEK